VATITEHQEHGIKGCYRGG